MPLSKVLWLVCLLITLTCIAGGMLMAGLWAGAVAVALPAAGLVVAGWQPVLLRRGRRSSWPEDALPAACLVGLVGLAAAGLLLGASPLLMLAGASAGLAGWDLVTAAAWKYGSPAIERRQIATLVPALAFGLLLAVTGKLIALQIPFGVLLVLIVLDLLGLDRMFRSANRRP